VRWSAQLFQGFYVLRVLNISHFRSFSWLWAALWRLRGKIGDHGTCYHFRGGACAPTNATRIVMWGNHEGLITQRFHFNSTSFPAANFTRFHIFISYKYRKHYMNAISPGFWSTPPAPVFLIHSPNYFYMCSYCSLMRSNWSDSYDRKSKSEPKTSTVDCKHFEPNGNEAILIPLSKGFLS